MFRAFLYMMLTVLITLILMLMSGLSSNANSNDLSEYQDDNDEKFSACVDEQFVAYYIKSGAMNKVSKANTQRTWSLRIKDKRSTVNQNTLDSIIDIAYMSSYSKVDKYQFSYAIFMSCMAKNKLEPLIYISSAIEA